MSAIPRLPRSFFERPVIEVAPDLLGTTIEHAGVRLRITEVEAYAGQLDPGSHAFRGPTPRTEVMFGPAGHLYVYFSYGMHWCANLVCGPDGEASAVLVRAGEVVSGEDLALERRLSRRPARLPVSSSTPPTGISRRDLARGPARLTTALGLDKASDGLDFCVEGSPLVFSDSLSGPVLPGRVRTGPRVGVSGAGGDGTAYPWRFWLDGESSVSPYRGGTVRGLVVRPADVR